jgi:hypothetical protein
MEDHIGFPEREARSRKDPGGDLVYVSLS